jgi:hypothetical protein
VAEVVIGLVDGPVALDQPDLATESVRTLAGITGACRDPWSEACRHAPSISTSQGSPSVVIDSLSGDPPATDPAGAATRHGTVAPGSFNDRISSFQLIP